MPNKYDFKIADIWIQHVYLKNIKRVFYSDEHRGQRIIALHGLLLYFIEFHNRWPNTYSEIQNVFHLDLSTRAKYIERILSMKRS